MDQTNDTGHSEANGECQRMLHMLKIALIHLLQMFIEFVQSISPLLPGPEGIRHTPSVENKE